MLQVAIETVLNKLNDTVNADHSTLKTFGVRFINSDGEKREIQCRKHTKDATKKVIAIDVRGKEFYNLQRHGVLLVDDIDSGHPRSLKVAMIYGFKDFQEAQWFNVFH